jgi:predicted DNA-binding transcriptional regulator AlpA
MNDTLMTLEEFLALTHLSRSNERKHRSQDEGWPPHIEIGRKVFYRRSTVEKWLAGLEGRG